MIITFFMEIELLYSSEEKITDEEMSREFLFELNNDCHIPSVGDYIDFDNWLETIIEPEDKPKWVEVWYGRDWTVESIYWKYNKEEKILEPTIHLKDSGK